MSAEKMSQVEDGTNGSLETQKIDIYDPNVLLNGFHNSAVYTEAYESRLEDLPAYQKYGNDMPSDLKKLVINEFRKTEKYKQGLWTYLERHPLKA